MIKTYKTKLNLNNRQKTKHNLKLNDRIYKCGACGFEVDRDYNASLNLKHYREFHGNLSLWRVEQTQVVEESTKEDSGKKEFYMKLDCQVSTS